MITGKYKTDRGLSRSPTPPPGPPPEAERQRMRMSVRLPVRLFLPVLALLAGAAVAAPVSQDTARQVARNWVCDVAHRGGGWAGASRPTLVDEGALAAGDTVLAWIFRVAPRGYVAVSGRLELTPVAASSETSHLPSREPGGFFDLLADVMAGRVRQVDADADAGRHRPPHPAWKRYRTNDETFQAKLLLEPADVLGAGPLLETTWHQGWPYNILCPPGDGARTFVGCTPLAAAQLLAYHHWPLRGEGRVAYWWAGDDGCGHTTPGDTLRAEYFDPYDWSLMPHVVDAESSESERAATAELCYEVALACRTDFSVCGSSASLAMARSALVNNYRFLATAREVVRFRYTDAVWFGMIQAEIGAGRPLLYSSIVHTMVCDGWRELGGVRQVHINYGWAGDSDNWFALDDIETSANPAAERMIIGLAPDTEPPAVVSRLLATLRPDQLVDVFWRVEGVLDAAGFYVWRGVSAADRVRLNDERLTSQAEYTWLDTQPGAVGEAYWLQEVVVGGPELWIGPAYLPPAPFIDTPEIEMTLQPNPANPRVGASFRLAAGGRVRAEVFDLAGRRRAVLLDGELPAGEHRVEWDGRDVGGRVAPSGLYLLRLEAGGSRSVSRFTLAR